MNRRIQLEQVAGMGTVILNVNFIEAIAEPGFDTECRVVMASGKDWEVTATLEQILQKINKVSSV